MKLPSISLNQEMLSHFEDEIRKEWLVTNGLGGYASSTVLGINTRKYHGLLVAALHPPGDRRVFLTKLDEDLSIGSEILRLGTNEFQDGFYPHGYNFLKGFSILPFPEYSYELPNVVVQKTIFMPYRKNAVIILYKVLNNSDVAIRMQVFPIVNMRYFHSTTERSKKPVEFVQKKDDAKVLIGSEPACPVLVMMATEGRYFAGEKWVERVFLREEANRGESCFDDCFQPGHFEALIEAGNSSDFAIVATADANEGCAKKVLAQLALTTSDVKTLYEIEKDRCKNLLLGFYGTQRAFSASEWLNWLVLAADSFVVQGRGKMQKAVIAGYHWFESWGRDTFISLPGLLLVTGRFDYARRMLLSFREYCEQGLIPNFLPEQNGEPTYNTVDATLWFVNAILQYLKYTGDFKFVKKQLWEPLKSIIEYHAKGTKFSIHSDADALLSHGCRLTWMDAAINGKPITPREGKAVEIQALWYNALKTAQLLGNRFGERKEAEMYAQMAERARKSFSEKFWNGGKGCLYDVVSQTGNDDSLRPNQILAVALDNSILGGPATKKVVDVVRSELLTPFGLRTLSQNDSEYMGVCVGDRESRDKAYHNGTIWPWLLGPFLTAFMKTEGYKESARRYAFENFLLPLFTIKISDGGLGTLSEIFDGNPPHASRGCVSQAWSVAEPLRAYVEDVVQARPRYENEVFRFLG